MPQPSRKGVFLKSEWIFSVPSKNRAGILTLLIGLLCSALAGCAPPAADPTPTVVSKEITPQVTLLSTTKSTQEPTPEQEKNSPRREDGHVERYQIDSELLDEAMYFSVYFPPCYSEKRLTGYPVLYALHGQYFNDTMWIDLGAADTADALNLSGASEGFLMVMPYEEFYFRSADGNNFPRALTEEIIPWVEGSLNVCAEKRCRAIGGISRGGSWAVRIGLVGWDFFGSVGAHSLPTFRGDISNLPQWLDEVPQGEEPRIYLDTGRFDPEVKNASRFEKILNENNIPHEWYLNEGRHNETYWEEQMENYLRWYAAAWKVAK